MGQLQRHSSRNLYIRYILVYVCVGVSEQQYKVQHNASSAKGSIIRHGTAVKYTTVEYITP